MTVDTTYEPARYTGDGSTVDFALNHKVFQASHLSVKINDLATGAWSATGYGGSGVTVTFDTAPPSGATIIIERIVPYTQETDLENFDGNPADVTEKQFDLLAMADQQINEKTDRSVLVPIGTSIAYNEISGTIDATAKILTISTSEIAATTISSFGDFDVVDTGAVAGDELVYSGSNWVVKKNNVSATTPPTVNDDSGDGYSVGSLWIDTTADESYRCLDASAGAAVWENSTLTIDDLGGAAVKGVDTDFTDLESTDLPTTQAVNNQIDAKLIFTESFESAEQVLTTPSEVSVAHGLSSIPKLIQVVLICKISQAGYAVGDEIDLSSVDDTSGNVSATSGFNSTDLFTAISSHLRVRNKTSSTTTPTLTDANWRIIFRAWA